MPTTNYGKASALGSDDLCETIRAVVREELRTLFPASQPQVHSIADVVREEVQHFLGVAAPSQPEPEAMNYAAVARHAIASPCNYQRPVPQQFCRETPQPHPKPSHPPTGQSYTSRKANVWRALEHRLLCYHCGDAGHMYRRCQYREMGQREFAVNTLRPQPGERPRDVDDYFTGTQW